MTTPSSGAAPVSTISTSGAAPVRKRGIPQAPAPGSDFDHAAAHKPRGSLRPILLALLCLTTGLLTTCLVAAACLIYAPLPMTIARGGFGSPDAEGRTPEVVFFKNGDVYGGAGLRQDMNYWIWPAPPREPGTPPSLFGAGVTTLSAGWPFHAFTTPPNEHFRAVRTHAEFNAAVQVVYTRKSTAALPSFLRAEPHREPPTRPLPLGLALNTIFYATLFGTSAFGFAAARRAHRRRAGRCTACAYPLTGGPRCPECGELVSPEVAT